MNIAHGVVLLSSVVACLLVQARGADNYTDGNRPYEFGFTIDGEQHRHEKKDEKGLIEGEFGFLTADGVYHVTVYATDEEGRFKILSMKNIRVKPYPSYTAKQQNTARQGHSLELPATVSPAIPPKTTSTFKPIPIAPPANSCSACSIPTTSTQAPVIPSLNQPESPNLIVAGQIAKFPQGVKPQSAFVRPTSGATLGVAQNYPNGPQNSLPGPQNPLQRELVPNPNSQPMSAFGSPQAGSRNFGVDNPLQSSLPSFKPQNKDAPNFNQQNDNDPGFNQQSNNAPGFNQQSNNAPSFNQQNNNAPSFNQQNNNAPSFNQQSNNIPSLNQLNNNKPALNQQSTPLDFPAAPPTAFIGRTPKRLDTVPPLGQQPNGVLATPNAPSKPTLISAQMQIVDKNTDIHRLAPGEKEGLPQGLTKDDMSNLLYTFNYTVGFHGHYEEGYVNGVKQGYYFVTGRNGVRTRIDYTADSTGFHPKISQEVLDLLSDDVPKPETEKEEKYGLKGYEFKWLYYPVEAKGR